jgi:prolipoprotein diacylglyceryltransferase
MITFDLNLTKQYYPLLYQCAFLLGFGVLIIEGIKRKLHFSSWLILIAFTVSFGILGSRLGTYGWHEWELFLTTGFISNFGQKSALGGFFLGTLVLMLVKNALGFKKNTIDAFAFFIPVLMMVQRLGCLCAGCCFGLPYSGFGGIHYSGYSFIRDYQIKEGLINHSHLTTVSVHAVPLYLILVSFSTIALLFWSKNKLKQPGSLMLLSIIGMTTGRFIVEFFRDPISNHALGNIYFGLKIAQWFMLAVLLLASFFLMANESKNTNFVSGTFVPKPMTQIWLALGLCLLVFKINAFFTTPELVILHLFLLAAVIELFRQMFLLSPKTWVTAQVKIIPLIFLFSSVFLMSQTYHYRVPNDSSKTQILIKSNLMYMNQLNTQYPCIQTASGCGGTYCALADTSKPMGPNYYGYNVGIDNYMKTGNKMDLNYGLNLQLEQYTNPIQAYTNLKANVYPYIGFDGKKYFGWRLGVRMGNIYSNEPENRGIVNYVPAGRFWFGYKPVATLQVGIFDSDVAGPFNSVLDLKLNANLLKVTHQQMSQASLGFSLNEYTSSFYAQAEINLKPYMSISPRIGQVIDISPYKGENRYGLIGGIGFRYNLGKH